MEGRVCQPDGISGATPTQHTCTHRTHTHTHTHCNNHTTQIISYTLTLFGICWCSHWSQRRDSNLVSCWEVLFSSTARTGSRWSFGGSFRAREAAWLVPSPSSSWLAFGVMRGLMFAGCGFAAARGTRMGVAVMGVTGTSFSWSCSSVRESLSSSGMISFLSLSFTPSATSRMPEATVKEEGEGQRMEPHPQPIHHYKLWILALSPS